MKSIGIVGAGPAGKAAARDLVAAGFAVTIYERQPESGGLLRYGYPEPRMPTRISRRDTEKLRAMGVAFEFGVSLGRDIGLDELAACHDAILIAVGAGHARRLGIPGEGSSGVWSALDFLHAARTENPPVPGSRVAVIGGGDTAVDAATTALDLGATEVEVLYRGPEANLRTQEREHAMAVGAGVVFRFETVVERIEPVDRLRLHLVTDKTRTAETFDMAVIAIGQTIDAEGWTGIEVGPDGSTSRPGVFVTGESREGPGLLAWAIQDGRAVARRIIDFLS